MSVRHQDALTLIERIDDIAWAAIIESEDNYSLLETIRDEIDAFNEAE